MDDDGDWLPLSSVFRFAHCPRQCYLFHAEGQHAENRFTVEGNLVHRRVTEGEDESRPGVRICRSLQLVSHRLLIRGVADVVEFHGIQPVPVEYKRGGKKHRDDERAQLALQAICLEEMLHVSVPQGFIWHAQTRRREAVPIDGVARTEAESLVDAVRLCLAADTAPPAIRKRHCASCSLVDHCLPMATDGGRSAAAWTAKRLET